MKATPLRPYGLAVQCEHLGAEHDRSTCLAYPSPWNYCYRASPAGAVGLAHQVKYCQTTLHTACPVYTNSATGPLPPGLRDAGSVAPARGRSKGLLPGLLSVLALVLLGLAILGTAAPTTEAAPQSPGMSSVSEGSTAVHEPVTLSTGEALPNLTSVPASIANPTRVEESSGALTEPSRTAAPTSSASRLCGHRLDEPFGMGRQFIIHRVKPGESIDAYATTYRTSAAAIEGINVDTVNPLKPDQIIIIPVNQQDIDEVPVFAAYELSERNTTVGEVAEMLGSTNLNDFLRYNGINTTCPIFSGWVIAPQGRSGP